MSSIIKKCPACSFLLTSIYIDHVPGDMECPRCQTRHMWDFEELICEDDIDPADWWKVSV